MNFSPREALKPHLLFVSEYNYIAIRITMENVYAPSVREPVLAAPPELVGQSE